MPIYILHSCMFICTWSYDGISRYNMLSKRSFHQPLTNVKIMCIPVIKNAKVSNHLKRLIVILVVRNVNLYLTFKYIMFGIQIVKWSFISMQGWRLGYIISFTLILYHLHDCQSWMASFACNAFEYEKQFWTSTIVEEYD